MSTTRTSGSSTGLINRTRVKVASVTVSSLSQCRHTKNEPCCRTRFPLALTAPAHRAHIAPSRLPVRAPNGRSGGCVARTVSGFWHLRGTLLLNVAGVGPKVDPMTTLVLFVVVLSAAILLLVFVPHHH
jgi:hypothetical protein